MEYQCKEKESFFNETQYYNKIEKNSVNVPNWLIWSIYEHVVSAPEHSVWRR
jgi:hypothetical protein